LPIISFPQWIEVSTGFAFSEGIFAQNIAVQVALPAVAILGIVQLQRPLAQ
jgi:hypothetical protein